MPNYQNACIYRITCKDKTVKESYVGSTTNLYNREIDHKSVCNNPNSKDYNINLYQFIREHGGWDNWVMEKVYDYPCNDKNELLKEERKVFEFYNDTLNTVIPSRTKKESAREWREKNKETIAEKKREWREKNKETIAENDKEYREKNKEKIAEKNREKIQCECGCFIRRSGIAEHRKSKKHQNLMNITP